MDNRRRKFIRNACITFVIIAAALIFNKILEEWTGFRDILDTITGAAMPIIIGFILAFLLNPVLKFFERLFYTVFQDRVIKDKRKLHKVSRGVCVALTILLFLGMISGLFSLVIPQLIDSIRLLISNMDGYYKNVLNLIDNLANKFQSLSISEEIITNVIDTIYDKLQSWVNDDFLPNLDKVVVNISTGVVGGLKFLYNFIIGIIASIYIMINKEYLLSRCKKVIYAVFNLKNANMVLDGLSEVNRIFSQFINGKIIDSIIIGIIMFILTSIVNMPYGLLISVIIGVTNIIPFFGPIIGAVPCVFIVLIADPVMSIVLLVMILIIQQVDGNIIGPKILGDSTGLSSFWVLTAVIVGGGIFGFYGMLLGVPVFACVYTFINRVCISRLKKKNAEYKSYEYEKIKRIDDETGEPIYVTEEEEDIRFKRKSPEEKQQGKFARLKNKIKKKEKHSDSEEKQETILNDTAENDDDEK